MNDGAEQTANRTEGRKEGDGKKGQGGYGRDAERQPTRSIFRRPIALIGGGVAIAILIVAAILWWLHARRFESTDDAFIDTHIVHLSPQIAGQVIRIDVDDNQAVKVGDPVAEIDPADAQAKLDQAQAQEAQAESRLDQAQAQIGAARAAYEQAESNESGIAAQAVNAAGDLARFRKLQASTPAAVAQQQIDEAIAQARNTAAQRDAAQKQTLSAAAQIRTAQAELSGAEAAIKAAHAQVEQARINLGYTRIAAPVAGRVTQRTVAVGNYVTPGQQMMAIVPLDLWVTANFKETQLAHMRVGQPADISIDACPSVELHGHVDSIQSGAGQAFGLLPAENATGNFVKVVQRVPVKIVLDDPTPRDCSLGPGMSVSPSVTVR